MKLDRMRDEAITYKKALDGVLDLISQTDIFIPDLNNTQPLDTDTFVEELRIHIHEYTAHARTTACRLREATPQPRLKTENRKKQYPILLRSCLYRMATQSPQATRTQSRIGKKR